MEEKITFTEGDGLKIFYKNGIYYKHQITNQYEYTRETK
jgi:hypothetical protein